MIVVRMHPPSTDQDSNAGASNAPETIQATLKEQLTTYRKQLSKKFAHTTALVGIELCTGLTDQTITSIAANCLNIHCEDDVLEYGVTSRVYCSTIFDIVDNVITKNVVYSLLCTQLHVLSCKLLYN